MNTRSCLAPWAATAAILISSAVLAAEPPQPPAYPDHQDLTYFLDDAGQKRPIRTADELVALLALPLVGHTPAPVSRSGRRWQRRAWMQAAGPLAVRFVLHAAEAVLVVMVAALVFTMISDLYPRRAVATIAGMGGMAGAAGGILIAQATGWTLELTGSYWPILIYAGLAYLIAFTVIHLLVPKMKPAPVAPLE